MRIGRVMLVFVLALGACSSSRKVQPGEGANIPTQITAGQQLRDVNFDYDSFDLNSAAKSVLMKNSEWLKSHPKVKVTVEGHCDERGTNEYNMVLGANRARSVMLYLGSLGVESGRMKTVSYGEELPLDTGHNEAAWSRNRRAHFDRN